ncbi:MAG: hypothetical protein IT452_11230 [Planctomycetia bacterium]|nr:hypothetical protein [Planctomycetia bacterium]
MRIENCSRLVLRPMEDWHARLDLRVSAVSTGAVEFIAEDGGEVYCLTFPLGSEQAPRLSCERLLGIRSPASMVVGQGSTVAACDFVQNPVSSRSDRKVRAIACSTFLLPRQLWSGSDLTALLGERAFLGHQSTTVLSFYNHPKGGSAEIVGDITVEHCWTADCLQVGRGMFYGIICSNGRFESGRVGADGVSKPTTLACDSSSFVRAIPSGSTADFVFLGPDRRLRILRGNELFSIHSGPVEFFDATVMESKTCVVARIAGGGLLLLTGTLEAGFEMSAISPDSQLPTGEFRVTSANRRLALLWSDLTSVWAAELIQD